MVQLTRKEKILLEKYTTKFKYRCNIPNLTAGIKCVYGSHWESEVNKHIIKHSNALKANEVNNSLAFETTIENLHRIENIAKELAKEAKDKEASKEEAAKYTAIQIGEKKIIYVEQEKVLNLMKKRIEYQEKCDGVLNDTINDNQSELSPCNVIDKSNLFPDGGHSLHDDDSTARSSEKCCDVIQDFLDKFTMEIGETPTSDPRSDLTSNLNDLASSDDTSVDQVVSLPDAICPYMTPP